MLADGVIGRAVDRLSDAVATCRGSSHLPHCRVWGVAVGDEPQGVPSRLYVGLVLPALSVPKVSSSLGATGLLAEFISNVPRRGVPDPVRLVLQTAVVDAVGCGLFGLTTPAARIIQEFAHEQGGPAQATLWASLGARVSSANAALAVGTAIHAFDFDDHHRSKIHPGAAVLPAVLALGEPRQIDGRTALAALAAGYEAMSRVSLAANPNSSRMRGWHLTGTCGHSARPRLRHSWSDGPTTASASAWRCSLPDCGLQRGWRHEQAPTPAARPRYAPPPRPRSGPRRSWRPGRGFRGLMSGGEIRRISAPSGGSAV